MSQQDKRNLPFLIRHDPSLNQNQRTRTISKDQKHVNKNMQRARKNGAHANGYQRSGFWPHLKLRGLEDDKDLSRHDP
jgi:hypothetical protein